MNKVAKAIQFIGIAVTGIGLIYGLAQNNMRMEFTYLGAGLLVFLIGFMLERR